jgi:uncharacterized LabA/DUF88 family protein
MRTLLYLDGENLHWSLMHHHSRELDLGVVLHLAATEGEVCEARLYADFSRFPREVATRALALGVDSMHVPSHPNSHSDGKWKSTTDQRLTLDCLERILTGPPVDAVVLAAGDGDYIHLVHKLRSHRVKVIVIGIAQTLSRLLREAADTVHCYPVPVQEKEPIAGAALGQAA